MLMLKAKFTHFWNSLDRKVTVNKREVFLGMTTCALAGMVVGMIAAPKANITIGSNNKSVTHAKDEDEKETTEKKD